MKWKEMTITIFACVLLIAAGTWGFSFLYQAMFRPETILGSGTVNSAGWQEEQALYEKEILYPFTFALETGTIEEIDGRYQLSDFYQIGQTAYSSVLKLAGLQWEDLEAAAVTAYQYQTDTMEYEEYGLRYLFHIAQAQDDRNDDMVIAVDKNDAPVLFRCGAADKPDEPGGDIIISHSTAVPDEFAAGLPDYLALIDTALEGQSTYWQFMRAVERRILTPYGEEVPPGSLVRYCEYGEWQIYSGTQATACVCIINDCNFILYYDMESGEFCGYSLALNDFG